MLRTFDDGETFHYVSVWGASLGTTHGLVALGQAFFTVPLPAGWEYPHSSWPGIPGGYRGGHARASRREPICPGADAGVGLFAGARAAGLNSYTGHLTGAPNVS